MTNLDSILKSRDIAKKGLSSQSYGFPVVVYGYESWIIKKVEKKKKRKLSVKELMLLNCGVGEDS